MSDLDAITADKLDEAIHSALNAGDTKAVGPLLHLLERQDPSRVQVWLDAIRTVGAAA